MSKPGDFEREISAEEAEVLVPAMAAILTTMREARAARKVDDWDWLQESILRQALRGAVHGNFAALTLQGEHVPTEDDLAHGLTRFALAVALRERKRKDEGNPAGALSA